MEGFSNPVYSLLLALFLFAASAAAFWFWLMVRHVWIGEQQLVAGRSGMDAVVRLTAVVLTSAAIPSGPLWAHY